jgi:hypothetical protein
MLLTEDASEVRTCLECRRQLELLQPWQRLRPSAKAVQVLLCLLARHMGLSFLT